MADVADIDFSTNRRIFRTPHYSAVTEQSSPSIGVATTLHQHPAINLHNLFVVERNEGSIVEFDESVTVIAEDELDKNYIALFLLIIPLLTIFGNALVVLSVIREKSLQTTTNYLIASLAVSDFLVAFCVMPFAVYVVVENSLWNLPKLLCNIYIAADVCASTASILNLAAVSWDRYMAISRPIQYARNSKNNSRVRIMIFVVWFISVAIALPVMIGLNDLEDTQHCEFTNAAYIVASSVGSFYLPCVIMVVLYSIVLRNLHKRKNLRRRQASPFASTVTNKNGYNNTVLLEADYATENVLHKNDLKLTVAQNWNTTPARKSATSTLPLSSSSLLWDQMAHSSSVAFEYESIPYIDAPSESDVRTTPNKAGCASFDAADSPFAVKAIETDDSPKLTLTNGLLTSHKKSWSGAVTLNVMKRNDRRYLNRLREARFRKETRATQTLAIVLGVFLLCWLPFFVCHLTNSVCMLRFGNMCIPIMAFFLTTWLGYMNSFMNPLIYTVFNAEYRKAFSNILLRKRSQPSM